MQRRDFIRTGALWEPLPHCRFQYLGELTVKRPALALLESVCGEGII